MAGKPAQECGRWPKDGRAQCARPGAGCKSRHGEPDEQQVSAVGRIYQQTFVDTYSKVTFAKHYDRKTPITAADLLNDRVVPFFDEKDVKLSRVLTDREPRVLRQSGRPRCSAWNRG